MPCDDSGCLTFGSQEWEKCGKQPTFKDNEWFLFVFTTFQTGHYFWLNRLKIHSIYKINYYKHKHKQNVNVARNGGLHT